MTETVGLDEQTRSLYSLAAFRNREKATPLFRLYEYWSALPRGPQGLPFQGGFRPEADLSEELAAQVCSIDTSANDPLDYIIVRQAPSTLRGYGTELAGRPLCDRRQTDMDTTACAVEFLFCKHERRPMYHEIDQILDGLKRHFTRIMLPVENDAGMVETIHYATRDLHRVRRVAFRLVEEA